MTHDSQLTTVRDKGEALGRLFRHAAQGVREGATPRCAACTISGERNNVFDGISSGYLDKIQFGSVASPVFSHNMMRNVRVSFDSPEYTTDITATGTVRLLEAIRETGQGKGCIDIDASLERENGRECVHLSVSDNGAGIDPSLLPNLFGRGFSTKTTKSGGIGLHWSANSVAAMGGRMYAESSGSGQGATFHIILPTVTEAEEAAA